MGFFINGQRCIIRGLRWESAENFSVFLYYQRNFLQFHEYALLYHYDIVLWYEINFYYIRLTEYNFDIRSAILYSFVFELAKVSANLCQLRDIVNL